MGGGNTSVWGVAEVGKGLVKPESWSATILLFKGSKEKTRKKITGKQDRFSRPVQLRILLASSSLWSWFYPAAPQLNDEDC